MSEVMEQVNKLSEELGDLEMAFAAREKALCYVGEANNALRNTNIGYGDASHHAEMELSESLEMVGQRMAEIEVAVNV